MLSVAQNTPYHINTDKILFEMCQQQQYRAIHTTLQSDFVYFIPLYAVACV